MASEIRANILKNRVGLGTVSFTNTGPVVSGIVTANTFRLPDATSGSLGRLQLGNGLHFSMYHDGTNSHIVNNNGYLTIQSQAGVNGIFIARNAEVNLYYGPSVRLQTSSVGVTINRDLDVDGHTNLDNVSIAGVSTFSGNIQLLDNVELNLGTHNDFDIFHNDDDAYIRNAKGALIIRNNGQSGDADAGQIYIQAQPAENSIQCSPNGAVLLYHDNQIRLSTTAVGVSINRDLDVDGHTNLDNVSVAGVSTFSGVVRVPAGSAAAPAIHFGDSDSGLYSAAGGSNNVRITAGGSDVLTASTNGVNFPIKATALTSFTLGSQSALSKPLYFADAASVQSSSILLDNSSQELRIKNGRFSGAITFTTYNTEKLRIDSSGRLLIGTTTAGDAASDNLTIADSANCGITIRSGSNSRGHIFFTDATSTQYQGFVRYIHQANEDSLSFGTATVERLRITSGGTVGINDSSPNTYFKLDVNGHTNIVGDVALPTTNRIYFGNSDTAFIKGEHGASAYLAFGANNEKMRLTRAGNLLLGGHSQYTYDDTGSSNVILDIYGGATAGKRGILSLSGRVGSDNGDLGTIWFNNDNNSGASPGNNMKLAAAIQAKSVTSDSNAQNDSGAYLQFFTKAESGSVTERLRISSQGYVLKTAHPSFYARRSIGGDGRSSASPVTEWVMPGSETSGSPIHNRGGHFNHSTGLFTAPVNGIYHFSAAAGYKQTNNSFNQKFRMNGADIAEGCRFVGTPPNSHSTSTISATMYMAAGDTMGVTIETTHHVNTTYNYFSGHLVG